MTTSSASAPAKIILIGEHAVVYNQPAIAVPVCDLRVKASITAMPADPSGQIRITSKQTDLNVYLSALEENHPFRKLIDTFCDKTGVKQLPAMHISLSSAIPQASGLGSGAAVSVAIIRALSCFLEIEPAPDLISEIAFDVEKIYHGTPSGIDNTVIAFEKAVYYLRNHPIEFLSLRHPLNLIIADTGVAAKTIEMVNQVKQAWLQNPEQLTEIFNTIGHLAAQSKEFLEKGNLDKLGTALTANHTLLQQTGVSTPLLDTLVETAIKAGACGAKLSGGGGGGNMIALAEEKYIESVKEALQNAGAAQVFTTRVLPG